MYKCRHCGVEFSGRHIDRHEHACLHNAALVAQLKTMIDDGNGRAVNRSVFRRRTDKPVSDAFLVESFGSWDAVADHFGLLHPLSLNKGWPGSRMLNAPLTDAERFCCQRRAVQEGAWHSSR
jgi:hypothetical protein